MSAPERIWLDWPAANKGEPVYDEPPERDTQPGQTGYVRADLHEALRAERDALAARVERLEGALRKIADSGKDRRTGAEYTTGEGHADCISRARAALSTAQEG